MINALIVEDEEPATLRLKKMLNAFGDDVVIVGEADTVASAIRWLQNHPQPDLIFLDIQLGDGLCFDIFRKTRVDSYIIFTTAYDEYAIKAFELNSIDYLLKPFDEKRLSASLEKFRKFRPVSQRINFEDLLESMENRKSRYKKRFVVSIADRIKIIEIREVAWLNSTEKNTFLSTFDNRKYPLEFSLDQLEELLNPEIFFRINRQYIINYHSLNKIHKLSKSRIKIEINPPAGEELIVSSTRTSEFRHWLDR